MLIISYGHTRGEIRKFLENKKLLNSTDETHLIDPASWTEESVNALIETRGLFTDKEVFFVDHVISELEPPILKDAKLLANSGNLIVFLENEPTKTTEKLEKSAVHVFKAPARKEEKPFNVFSLTDALFEKDKKKLWLLYQRALLENLDPEFDVHRIFFWGVKMLALAKKYGSAISAGISPFVYGKAKKGAGNFKEGDIEKISQELTHVVLRARAGEEWEFLLERFVLSL